MADAANNSAASMAASTPMKIENISIPGFGKSKANEEFDPTKYRVKYLKLNMDDVGSLAELEIIETKGLTGIDTVVLNKMGFSFMDQYHMIVTYLEKIGPTS